ncbi:hypothetical protein JCM17380_06620 [Desulfosporosinus burensis]
MNYTARDSGVCYDVYVNKGSNHNLIITFDYSPERVKKIKQITNRWNPVEKYWEIADTEQSIRRFLNAIHDEEVIFDPRIKKYSDFHHQQMYSIFPMIRC